MSDTKTINPTGSETGKAKKVAGQAATIAGAAGLGVAGTMFANADSNNGEDAVPEVEVISDDASETTNQPNENQPSDSHTAASPSNTTTSSSTEHSEPEVIEELQPITEDPHEEEQNVPEEQIQAEEEQHEEPTNGNQNGGSNPNDTVNPDEIADALIAEEQIDPNDIDMTDVVNFDEIGTVYTVDGDSYTAAAFHDAAGNQLVMIDVDGDNTFDIVTDEYGNPLVDQNGELLAAGDLTVDDAESAIHDDATYLAHNDAENIDDFDADSLAQDLIS